MALLHLKFSGKQKQMDKQIILEKAIISILDLLELEFDLHSNRDAKFLELEIWFLEQEPDNKGLVS